MRSVPISLLAISLFLAGCSTTSGQLQNQVNEAAKYPVSHFRETLSVRDDALEATAVLSTINGFRQKHGLLGIVWNDAFLRAHIDKANRERTFQVYVIMRHQSGDWLFPYQANFGSPLQSIKTDKVNSSVDCTFHEYSGCTYTEQVVFEVPEEELRRYGTAPATEEESKLWRFRIKTQAGVNHNDYLFRNEVLGLLEAVDEFKPVPMK